MSVRVVREKKCPHDVLNSYSNALPVMFAAFVAAMTLSGFTFIRNGLSLGYPFQESLASLLALCDDVVIAVGDSHDGTMDYVRGLGESKLRVVETTWDDTLREGGKILAQQTDIALQECRGDWCVYLQGDEVLHEADYDRVRSDISRAENRDQVEGLLFRWLHLFGSYNYQATGRQWYRREIRAFRNTGQVRSWGDAQGFRIQNADGTFRKLRVMQSDARVFHYGWVRHPRAQNAKAQAMNRLYHDDQWMHVNIPQSEEFVARCYELQAYTGSHPAIMRERIERDRVWTSQFDPKKALKSKPFRVVLSDSVERLTGWRMGEYKNFVEVH